MTAAGGAAVELRDISVVYDGKLALDRLDWRVRPGERWVVLGPNGSGKTTLVRIVSLYLHPSRGDVCVLGAVLGRVDIRKVRPRIGVASASMAAMLRRELEVIDVVMTARNAALEPWWHTYTDEDRARALGMLDRFGMAGFAHRMFGTLSSGEQQKVQLARTLMADPELLILDEPAAGLDLGAREDLVSRLGDLARDPTSPPLILVTHHVDEIPHAFTHALLLRGGRAVACGPIADALTATTLSECFDLPLTLDEQGGRWVARAPADEGSTSEAGEQPGAAVLDLVAEHPLEHWPPQRPPVVKVHHEAAAAVGGRDRRLEHPRCVRSTIGLAAVEGHPVRRALDADHSQALRAGEGAEAAAQVDEPGGARVSLHGRRERGRGDDVEPVRIAVEVVHPCHELVGRAGSGEICADVHPSSIAARAGNTALATPRWQHPHAGITICSQAVAIMGDRRLRPPTLNQETP